MGPVLSVLAWLVCAAPLCAAALFPIAAAGGVGHTGLVLVPWIALAGLPGAGERDGRSRGLVPFALLLPPLSLAAHLDLAGGAPIDRLALALVAAGGSLCLLALAARRAAPGGLVHPLSWLALVAGPPVLARSMLLGSGTPLPRALDQVVGASPLEAALRLASGRPIGSVQLALVAASSLVLLALTEAERRRRGRA